MEGHKEGGREHDTSVLNRASPPGRANSDPTESVWSDGSPGTERAYDATGSLSYVPKSPAYGAPSDRFSDSTIRASPVLFCGTSDAVYAYAFRTTTPRLPRHLYREQKKVQSGTPGRGVTRVVSGARDSSPGQRSVLVPPSTQPMIASSEENRGRVGEREGKRE
eukprot:3811605-Rhodomonas_salina.1